MKWTPAEKAILNILKIISAMKPCFNNIMLTFINFSFCIFLATKSIVIEIISSPSKKHSMMLQLFMKFPETYIFSMLRGIFEESLTKFKLSPLKVLNLVSGAKYILRKSWDESVKYESCKTPKSSSPIILQLKVEIIRIT